MERFFRINIGCQKPLSESKQRFPVVIFSHGLSACRYFYTIFCSSLASHGYIIAAIEHRLEFYLNFFSSINANSKNIVKILENDKLIIQRSVSMLDLQIIYKWH